MRGFSLVELSIVLVILGLLTGGILAGQTLIRAAELRKVTTQYDQIRTATQTFRDKYFSIPGDFRNATKFWGAAADCYAATTGTATCDGSGNGRLAYVISDSSAAMYEPWQFWKQLGNAELIPGSYTGFSDNTRCPSANYCLQAGVNAMAGPFSGSAWFASSVATIASKAWQGRAGDQNRNFVALGNPGNLSGVWYGASIGASEAWNIDTKMDDGKPYTGSMVDMSGTSSSYTPNCATANSDEFQSSPPGTSTNSAEYQVALNTISSSQGCLPIFDLE